MSITNELREFMAGADGYELWCPRHKAELTYIADRINTEHEHEIDRARKQYDATVAQRGWIRLPKDADGEYIHPKDMLTDGKKVYTVTNITFNQCGFIVYGYGDNSRNEWPIDEVSKLHHHHEQTVENVLREFALEIDPSADIAVTGAETIKKFAAKLQLKAQ